MRAICSQAETAKTQLCGFQKDGALPTCRHIMYPSLSIQMLWFKGSNKYDIKKKHSFVGILTTYTQALNHHLGPGCKPL